LDASKDKAKDEKAKFDTQRNHQKELVGLKDHRDKIIDFYNRNLSKETTRMEDKLFDQGKRNKEVNLRETIDWKNRLEILKQENDLFVQGLKSMFTQRQKEMGVKSEKMLGDQLRDLSSRYEEKMVGKGRQLEGIIKEQEKENKVMHINYEDRIKRMQESRNKEIQYANLVTEESRNLENDMKKSQLEDLHEKSTQQLINVRNEYQDRIGVMLSEQEKKLKVALKGFEDRFEKMNIEHLRENQKSEVAHRREVEGLKKDTSLTINNLKSTYEEKLQAQKLEYEKRIDKLLERETKR
jgi:hypothetical protein